MQHFVAFSFTTCGVSTFHTDRDLFDIYLCSFSAIISVVKGTYGKLYPCHCDALFGISCELHRAADQKREKQSIWLRKYVLLEKFAEKISLPLNLSSPYFRPTPLAVLKWYEICGELAASLPKAILPTHPSPFHPPSCVRERNKIPGKYKRFFWSESCLWEYPWTTVFDGATK